MDLTGGELRSIVRFRGYVLVVRYFTVGVGFWHEKWWRAPTYINMRFNYSLPIFNSFTMWTLAFRPQPSVDCLTITDIRDYRYRSYAIEWMSSLMSYWIARFRRNFRNSCYDQMAWLIVLFIKVYCAHRNEPPSGKAINPERFELNSLLNQVTSCHLSISRFIVYKPGWRCKNFSELSVQDAYGVEVKDKIPGTHAICSQVPMKTPYSLDGLFTPFLSFTGDCDTAVRVKGSRIVRRSTSGIPFPRFAMPGDPIYRYSSSMRLLYSRYLYSVQ